jgi:hypothetical protein
MVAGVAKRWFTRVGLPSLLALLVFGGFGAWRYRHPPGEARFFCAGAQFHIPLRPGEDDRFRCTMTVRFPILGDASSPLMAATKWGLAGAAVTLLVSAGGLAIRAGRRRSPVP